MSSITTKSNKLLGYVDFNYKGYNFIEAQTRYEVKKLELPTDISGSVIQYPLGDITKIYPIGSLISLISYAYRNVRIKIKWKNPSGTTKLTFFNRNSQELVGSGITTKNTADYEEVNIVLTIPAEATYLVIKNEIGTPVSIAYLQLWSVETVRPEGLSSILLNEVEAVKSTFKLWLFSRRGDYGRKITKGGPLDWILGKPINQITSDEIKDRLITEIQNNYYDLTANEFIIQELPEEKKYRITLYISDNTNKFKTSVTFDIGE